MISDKRFSISRKLLTLGILGSTIPLLLFGAVVLWQGNRNVTLAYEQSEKLAAAGLGYIVQGCYGMLVSQQELLEKTIANNTNVAENELVSEGGISLGSKKIDWQATNQLNGLKQSLSLPQLQIGKQSAIAVH